VSAINSAPTAVTADRANMVVNYMLSTRRPENPPAVHGTRMHSSLPSNCVSEVC